MAERPQLLEATDDVIDDAVRYADPMVLRGLLYQLTGDESIAAMQVSLGVVGFLEVSGLENSSDVELLQAKAAAFLKSYRDEGAGLLPVGPTERLQRSVSLTVGVDVPARQLELWLEQLALDPWARGLNWKNQPPPERLQNFSVAVIGAGMGGLNAAVHLKRAGIPFVVLEKNAGVGGTWYENRYPGARVDAPSRSYNHIYGVDFEYPNPFCEQPTNEKYFNWMADNFEIRSNIEFDTEVKALTWDEDAKVWEIVAHGPDGPRVWHANAVISAVGFLARPNIPQIDGLADFAGPAFHTARWPSGLDLAGKRVAVIGSGCTGYQLVPEVAKMAEHTYVFQRTPNWCFETPGYLAEFPEQVSWLDRNLPYHTNFMRLRISWLYGPETFMPAFAIDPEFEDPHARSALNKRIRDGRIEFMKRKFADRPDLFDKMLPIAPPMSARPVLVDQDYSIYDALLRDDVSLVTEGIEKSTTSGLVTVGGDEYPVDVIVMATGFRANDFLWPMDVRGRHGCRLEDLWKPDGARAYLGSMVPGFPNFFMVYGPNTNPTGGLSVVDLQETVTRFALECIRGLIEQDKRSVDVTADGYWRYNAELDKSETVKLYSDPRAKSYYQNEYGRSAGNCPLDGRKLWGWLRDPAGSAIGDGLLADGSTDTTGIRPHFNEDLVVQ